MILAADLGGTKTVMALFDAEQGVERPLREETFPSRAYDSLEVIMGSFLQTTQANPTVACFGVAGPVVKGRSHITNLPWVINADAIRQTFDIPHVHLLNDLQATAIAVPHLTSDSICTLNVGRRDPTGTIGVVAPGTGLGEAFLVWTGHRYQSCPTEGGHATFAPVTREQAELLAYLEARFGHVSYERVCSGSGIPNLYDYLRMKGQYDEPDWLLAELAQSPDLTPVIMKAALAGKAGICVATLDLFVRILGGVVSNLALQVFATGGLYLGGGIPPRILSRLQRPDFVEAICYQGRFSDWVARIPVHVILDPKAALHGAAWHALEVLDH
jgi:glucokinase